MGMDGWPAVDIASALLQQEVLDLALENMAWFRSARGKASLEPTPAASTAAYARRFSQQGPWAAVLQAARRFLGDDLQPRWVAAPTTDEDEEPEVLAGLTAATLASSVCDFLATLPSLSEEAVVCRKMGSKAVRSALALWFSQHKQPSARDCQYVCRQVRRIQEHCRKEHNWQNDWVKGGNVKRKAAPQREVPWTTGVLCQRFFPSRAGNRWFEEMDDDKRPPYRLTPKQGELWDRFEQAAEDSRTPQAERERAGLDMLISMLDHQLKRGHYENALISALVVMGIREDGGWVQITDYTNKYSA
ncbi:hypothetical protein CMUS01_16689, partial [Colletotrichum musicola]